MVVRFIRLVANNGFQILYILPRFQSFLLKSVSLACLLYVNINDVSNFEVKYPKLDKYIGLFLL